MALEPGGYADKLGNRYEGRWVARQLLRLLNEKISSLSLERVGKDEEGVDVWIEELNGVRNAQQCKIRNRSVGQWSISSLTNSGILAYMQEQLARDSKCKFSLVSPIPSPLMQDICDSARNSTGDPEEFYQYQIIEISKERIKAFHDFCSSLSLNSNDKSDRSIAFSYLSRLYFENWPDSIESNNDLMENTSFLVNGESKSVIANLVDFAESNLRKTITPSDVWDYLRETGFTTRTLSRDGRISPGIQRLKEIFHESISGFLIEDQLIRRNETEEILDALEHDEIVLLHGKPGIGKSSVLYELTESLKNSGFQYLPIRLDRQTPKDTTIKFGESLGLPESPTKCLDSISRDRKCILILDQLDAIRWTFGHSKNSLDVCKDLVREVRILRDLGKDIRVVISCRTYDLEHDPDIKSWINSNKTPSAKIEIAPLSINSILAITSNFKVSNLTEKQISILSSPQHLAMWVKLAKSGLLPDFQNRAQLMREYWGFLLSELEQLGVSNSQANSEISIFVEYMENKGVISAPYSLVENPNVLEKIISVDLLQLSSANKITFSHQSYLDYQIAIKLVKDIFRGSGGLLKWLGNKDKQTLYRREQLRQALGLLSEESPEDFLEEVKELLNSDEVRFNLKHLVLEIIGQIQVPPHSILNLVTDLLDDSYWTIHVLDTVFYNHPDYVRHLSESGIILKWLDSESEKKHALDVLRSVNRSAADIVVSHLSGLMSDSTWHEELARCLNWDVSDDTQEMFEFRLKLAGRGVLPNYFAWEKMSSERSILLFQAILQSYEYEDFTYDKYYKLRNSRSRFEKWDSHNHEKLKKQAADDSERTWKILIPEILRLAPVNDHSYGTMEMWLDKDKGEFRNGREILPYLIVELCINAGADIALEKADQFWEITGELRGSNSFVVKNILATAYKSLPTSNADRVLKWFITACPDLIAGTAYSKPEWIPAKDLLSRFSEFCSDYVFHEIENRIYSYKDQNIVENAKHALPYWKHGYYKTYWGEAQYFLLPALSKKKRNHKTDDLIKVLDRKFSKFDTGYFTSGLRTRGGAVTSKIPRNRLPIISDRAWLKIIQNEKTSEECRLGDSVYEDNCVRESSIRYFSMDLQYMATREPTRFARLALQFPDNIHPAYKGSILQGLQKSEPSDLKDDEKKSWRPVKVNLLLRVLNKFNNNNQNEDNYPSKFCSLIKNRANEKWPDHVLDRLIYYATEHEDPRPNQLHVSNSDQGFDADKSTPHNLETNSINCVRGEAANTIGALLWKHEDLYPKFKQTLEHLASDYHPAVKVAALDAILPATNIEKDWAIRLFLKIVESDPRIAGTRIATHYYNYFTTEYIKQIEPIVDSMLASKMPELREQGAEEVAARWIFHDIYKDKIEGCISGDLPKRKSLANIASHFIENVSYFEKCSTLIHRLQNDKEKEVRNEVNITRKADELLQTKGGIDFLVEFTDSLTFKDDPTLLMYQLEKYSCDILLFSDLLISIGVQLIDSTREENPKINHDTHLYIPLMVRLYEQANEKGQRDIASQCLDIFDGMYENRIGSYQNFTQMID